MALNVSAKPSAGPPGRLVAARASSLRSAGSRRSTPLAVPRVPVLFEEQPVLQVVPRDQAHLTERALADQAVDVLADWIEAKVVVRRVHAPAALGDLEQVGGLGGRHGERLLADDMLAGAQRRARVLVMQVVGGGDMDDLDARIGKHRLEALVCGPEVQLARAGRGALAAPAQHT